MHKNISLTGFAIPNTPDLTPGLEGLVNYMESGDLNVEVARTYNLEEAATAQRDVVEDSFVGKLVILL